MGVAKEQVASHHGEHEGGFKSFAIGVAIAFANRVDKFF